MKFMRFMMGLVAITILSKSEGIMPTGDHWEKSFE